jgi:methyl-accepting chemotaxis protein
MTIRKKIFGIIMFFIFVSIAIGAGGLYGLYWTGNSIKHIVKENIPISVQAGDLHAAMAGTRIYEKEFFLFAVLNVKDRRDNYYKKYMTNIEKMKTALNEMTSGNTNIDAAKLEVIGAIETSVNDAEASFKKVADLLMKGKPYLEIQDTYVPYRTNVRALKANILKLKEMVSLENEQVSNESTALQKKFFMVFLIAVSVLVILGVLIGFIFNRRMSNSLKAVMEGIKAVSRGEMAVLPEKSSDEIGEISRVFNETMKKLGEYIKTDEERRKSQENVVKFLDVVSTAAEGDFTRRAPVTTDVFGSVADAFNVMMEELAGLIREVRATAEGIGEYSFNTLELLKNMAEGSKAQMVKLRDATQAVDETSQTTLIISEKTQNATGLSIKAAEESEKGEQLISESIEGMQLIRAAVKTINKKMKMFSERIIEIGTISGLIADIATRTNLLAMNASIEAARAGEAGKGFVVIAEEIRHLADRSGDATSDITDIIRSIQTEAGEITSSLEDETEIVEKQAAVASEIKTSFTEIKNAIDQSKGIVLEISPLSDTQREVTGNVVEYMDNVNNISQKLLELVHNSESISEKLSNSSKELLASVEKFKLSGDEWENEAVYEPQDTIAPPANDALQEEAI